MRKAKNASLALVLTTTLATFSAQAADYLPGQQIERPVTSSQRLGKSFLPGLWESSESPYATNFIPEDQDEYVFRDSFVRPGNVVEDRDGRFESNRDVSDAPVSNVFKFRY